MLDLLRRGVGMLVQERFGGYNEARRTESARCASLVDKRLLNGMKTDRLAKPFHSSDLRALRVDGKNRAANTRLFHPATRSGAAGAADRDTLGALSSN